MTSQEKISSVPKKVGRRKPLFGVIVVALALLFTWSKLGYPQSLAEARFLSKLKSAASKDVQHISLTELMPGDWETVCESHGYYGPLYVEKYDKTFPATGAMQDGAWGLIFIKTDGTYEPISSSCGQGVNINFSNVICFSRGESVLLKEETPEHSSCRSYEMLPRQGMKAGK
jgi:hypothetical protein